jgi:hypothetical protein
MIKDYGDDFRAARDDGSLGTHEILGCCPNGIEFLMSSGTPKILPALSNSLRKALPARGFEFVRFRWWCISFYLPRLIVSWFAKPTPEVRGFGGTGGALHLVKQLQSVNALAPTKLCRIMTKNGSDKGHGGHNYTTVYSVLFEDRRDQPLRVFELGLGTNNPEVPFNVGLHAKPGASLRGWREFFPHALVYGADIDRGVLFQEDRIKTFYCDQLDQAAIHALWSQPDLQSGVDIIIEDGMHTFEANVSFLEGSLEHLRPGGIFIIEDILRERVNAWYHQLESVYSKRWPTYEFAFVVLPKSFSPLWNNLLVIRRAAE